MTPHRDNAESIAAELARVTRERDEAREALAQERRGTMPSTRSYVLALAALLVAMGGGMVWKWSQWSLSAFAVGLGIFILRPALRRSKPEALPPAPERHVLGTGGGANVVIEIVPNDATNAPAQPSRIFSTPRSRTRLD